MKKTLSLLFIVFVAVSCNYENAATRRAKAQRDSIMFEAEKKDQVIDDFVKSFNEIQDNLSTIKEKEEIIRVNATDGEGMTVDAKDQINEDILTIYKLMLDNKTKLKELNERLQQADYKQAEFQKMIESLTDEIEEKNGQIRRLKTELGRLHIDLENLNIEVDSLSYENTQKSEIIAEQTVEMNTAFFVYGTKKELKTHEIITKEGGFIGMGRMAKLKDNFDKGYFTKIDIRETTQINFTSKKASLVTSHPSDSYVFLENDGKVSGLKIKNPTSFWSISKYLVILID